MSTDFPQPDFPSTTRFSPEYKFKLMPFKTSLEPNDLYKSFISIMGSSTNKGIVHSGNMSGKVAIG
jgi:hypothetical protein